MDIIEICNNNLIAGLKCLKNNPNYQYLIRFNGIDYTDYSTYDEKNEICIFDKQGNNCSMDLNDFVKKVQDEIITFNVTERR